METGEAGMDHPMVEDGSMEMESQTRMGESMEVAGATMEKDGSMMAGDSAAEPAAMAKPDGRYVAYSPDVLATATRSGRAVLFFKADWCPTCQAADRDFRANLDRIPDDVTVLLVNYDGEPDLKKKYRVTYQHTFIEVDGSGQQVSRWNGGGVRDLLANLG